MELGDRVIYRDQDGRESVAFVTAISPAQMMNGARKRREKCSLFVIPAHDEPFSVPYAAHEGDESDRRALALELARQEGRVPPTFGEMPRCVFRPIAAGQGEAEEESGEEPEAESESEGAETKPGKPAAKKKR